MQTFVILNWIIFISLVDIDDETQKFAIELEEVADHGKLSIWRVMYSPISVSETIHLTNIPHKFIHQEIFD